MEIFKDSTKTSNTLKKGETVWQSRFIPRAIMDFISEDQVLCKRTSYQTLLKKDHYEK